MFRILNKEFFRNAQFILVCFIKHSFEKEKQKYSDNCFQTLLRYLKQDENKHKKTTSEKTLIALKVVTDSLSLSINNFFSYY